MRCANAPEKSCVVRTSIANTHNNTQKSDCRQVQTAGGFGWSPTTRSAQLHCALQPPCRARASARPSSFPSFLPTLLLHPVHAPLCTTAQTCACALAPARQRSPACTPRSVDASAPHAHAPPAAIDRRRHRARPAPRACTRRPPSGRRATQPSIPPRQVPFSHCPSWRRRHWWLRR